MKKALIDSDVILDVYFGREPFSESSKQILFLCERQKIEGFVTPVIVSNVYYILKKQSNHLIALKSIKKLLAIVDIIIIDKEVIIKAINSDFQDFEDALQNFSAVNSKLVSIIVTRNVRDYKSSKLAILTPEFFLKGINIL